MVLRPSCPWGAYTCRKAGLISVSQPGNFAVLRRVLKADNHRCGHVMELFVMRAHNKHKYISKPIGYIKKLRAGLAL